MRYAPPLIEIDIVCASAWMLVGAACLLLWWRQRTQAARALAEARCQIARLSASQHALRDAERRRIARDLHDDLGQQLLTLSLDTRTLQARYPALQAPLEQLAERIRLSTRAMRAIVQDLADEALHAGLEDAVQQQIAQFSRLSGIRCRLDAEPEAFRQTRTDGMDTVLYRVLQESLSNIVRHAQASEVCVGLCREDHRLNLTVRDNGIGLPQPGARRGHGLRGIAQRVSEAGGSFDIASTPGAGTALTMSFPIP